MATAQFGKDRNWEGYIRIVYTTSQDVANNRTYVNVTDVQFKSIEGRTATWTIYGAIRIDDYPFSYSGDSFYTSGGSWVSMDPYWDDYGFYVYHDSSGNGSFQVKLQAVGSYNDFNVFHPNGGSYNCEYSNNTKITVTLPAIDRSAATVGLTATANTNGSVTLSATSNVSCNGWKYQMDNGSWTVFQAGSGTSASITIPGVGGGQHSFRVMATKISNGVDSYSSTVSTNYPALGFTANSATTDGSIALNASNLPSEGCTINIKYLNTTLETITIPSEITATQTTLSSARLKGLFEYDVTTYLKTMTVTAVVDGYSAATASFTLTAGNNMKPVVGTPTLSIVQTGKPATYFPDMYIAGYSKVKIAAEVSLGSNVAISTVKCTYGTNEITMTWNSTTHKYEGTTSAPITGNLSFTVTATDGRGMSGQNSASLTGVKSYTAPSVVIDTGATYRCDQNGNQTDGGSYVRVRATMTYDTGITGNTCSLYFYVEEDGAGTTHSLTSGVQSSAYAMTNPGPNDMVTVVVAAVDLVSDAVERRLKLSALHKDVVVMRDGTCTGVGIGLAPQKRQQYDRYLMSNVDLPGSLDLPEKGGVFLGGVNTMDFGPCAALVEGSSSTVLEFDVLNVDERNPAGEKNQTAEILHGSDPGYGSWTNLPSTVSSGTFEGVRLVMNLRRAVMVILLEVAPTLGRIWVNFKYKNIASPATTYTWKGWKGHTPNIT